MTVKTDKKSRSGAEQLFPALLFFVFLLCTVFTILIGSRVYENYKGEDYNAWVLGRVKENWLALDQIITKALPIGG